MQLFAASCPIPLNGLVCNPMLDPCNRCARKYCRTNVLFLRLGKTVTEQLIFHEQLFLTLVLELKSKTISLVPSSEFNNSSSLEISDKLSRAILRDQRLLDSKRMVADELESN